MAKELCRNCNREIDSSQRFCIHCGEKIVSQNDEGNLSKETRNEEKITELSNKIVQLSERLDLISNQLSEISSKGLKEAESVPKPTIESQESEEDYIVCKNCWLKFGEANLFCVHCGVKVSDIEESKENKSPETHFVVLFRKIEVFHLRSFLGVSEVGTNLKLFNNSEFNKKLG